MVCRLSCIFAHVTAVKMSAVTDMAAAKQTEISRAFLDGFINGFTEALKGLLINCDVKD